MNSDFDFYPPNCPEVYDEPYVGNLYFLVENNPVKLCDTQTSFDKNMNKNKDNCQRRANSCGKDINYLLETQQLFPFMKQWHHAKLLVNGYNDGKLKQTGRESHYSFWADPEIKLSFYTRLEVL